MVVDIQHQVFHSVITPSITQSKNIDSKQSSYPQVIKHFRREYLYSRVYSKEHFGKQCNYYNDNKHCLYHIFPIVNLYWKDVCSN